MIGNTPYRANERCSAASAPTLYERRSSARTSGNGSRSMTASAREYPLRFFAMMRRHREKEVI